MAFSVPNNGQISIPGSIQSSNSIPVSGSNFIGSLASATASRYAPVLVDAAISRLDSTVQGFANSISGSGNSGGNGGNNNNPGSAKSSSNSGGNGNDGSKSNNGKGSSNGGGGSRGGRRASRAPKGGNIGATAPDNGIPQFTINSGIESGVLRNPLQRTTDHYSPLYVQCGCFFSNLDEQDGSYFSSLINSELYFKYLIIVQSVITNSYSRQFTELGFYRYISTLTYALQMYYMVDSILAYTSHTPNENIAMYQLRMQITPSILNAHTRLKTFLENMPIPPNLLEYIRYMYQNYSFNNVSGSSIIRLSLEDSLCTSEYNNSLGLDEKTYSFILKELLENSDVASIIRRIRSNWVKSLPPSSYEALYDPQFSTFWHNSNICYEDYGSKAVKSTINASSLSETLYYGIFDNRLDGLIYASCSVDVSDVQQMGMWKPFTSFADRTSINSSLLHYSNDGTMRPVTDVQFRNASMVHAAPHLEINDSGTPVWKVVKSNFAGSAIPQSHTLENTTQAVTRSVNWLMEPV